MNTPIAPAPCPTPESEPTPVAGPRRLQAVPRQLSLPYEYDVAPGVPAVPPVPPDLRTVGSAPEHPTGLPDPVAWSARLARAVAEVASGERPPTQLTKLVARDVLGHLALRGQWVQRHPSARAQRGVARLRAVRAVRACTVAPGIVETSAVLVGGDRAHAIAIRLEAVEGQWLATAVQLG